MSAETQRLDQRPVFKMEKKIASVMKPTRPIPQMPLGHRVAVIDGLSEEFASAGLIMADSSTEKANTGELVAAGLAAMDVLQAHGVKLGDKVSWGAYCGVKEEWAVPPKEPGGRPRNVTVWYMSVNDLVGSFGVAERLNAEEIAYCRGKTADGRIQHYIEEK